MRRVQNFAVGVQNGDGKALDMEDVDGPKHWVDVALASTPTGNRSMFH